LQKLRGEKVRDRVDTKEKGRQCEENKECERKEEKRAQMGWDTNLGSQFNACFSLG
jgi:hypothetical protein